MNLLDALKFYKSIVESSIEKTLNSSSNLQYTEDLKTAMQYAMQGGKKIRGCLLLLSAQACGGDINSATIQAAAASVEFIHTYSLIQDDLPCMDNDLIRRGRPALHCQFDEATALLAGDALFALAFEQLAISNSLKACQAMHLLARCCGLAGLSGGQFADLNPRKSLVPSHDLLSFITDNKTASLISTSCGIGALLSDASTNQINMLAEYGRILGYLYQLTDDLLDEDPDKVTFVSTYGRPSAQNLTQFYTKKALDILEEFPQAEHLRQFVHMIQHRKE